MNSSNVASHLFWVNIIVYKGRFVSGAQIERLEYRNMEFWQRVKYDWYFEYRRALLQVKYPKYLVMLHHGKNDKEGISKEKFLRSQVSNAQGQFTKVQNKIKKAEEHWNKLFPISDDPIYQKALNKLEAKRSDLKAAQNELNEFLNSNN